MLEGALTSSQRSTELPEVSTAPVEASQQHERAEGLQDHGARTAEPHTLTAAERRRQISRTNRFARYEQIVTLHREGRERARDREASARQPQGGPSLGASWNLSGARAHWEASEQTRSLLARAFASAGKRAVTTASNSRVNSRPKDFADPPRWSVASLATGEHACLDHRSECAARNGRQLPPPGDVSHPDAHPGYSSKTRSSSRQANERSLSGSAKSMPTFRNSTNWDKTLCRWSGSDKHAAWTPGWLGLTRVPRWNCGDLLLALRAITPPSKRPCPFHGVRGRWRVKLHA